MRRRRFLATLSALASGVAGCTGRFQPAPESDKAIENVTGADGNPSNICAREPRPERIPAIVGPAFDTDWSGIGQTLRDGTTVVGLERSGEARAYPLTVLRFEIVNDHFDAPVLVTYCPLCSSGLTAIREVNGQATVFGNTSYTWQPPSGPGQTALDEDRVFGLSGRGSVEPTNDPNLVMFDGATGSYWSQLLGQAICGPLTGETLTLIPSTVTTWSAWREAHPDTEVLLPPPPSRTMTG